MIKPLHDAAELTLVGTGSSVLGPKAKIKSKAGAKETEAEPMYIYNHGDNGFVIVSGEDTAEPILAYSTDGAFKAEGMPAQIREWLQTYADEMKYATTHTAVRTFEAPVHTAKANLPSAVSPIMKYNGTPIQWEQNSPFNDDCPKHQGYNSVAGCVATALGQIMYYHRWPEKGAGGTKTYITATYGISESYNFSNATFNFDNMLPKYLSKQYTEEQGKAVADFTHAIGVAVQMDYAPEGSGAKSLDVGNAMVKYFNYDKNIHYVMRDFFDLDEWLEMIKTEISQGRPICYAGTSTSVGHQFVFDGYDANNLVHVNWGWAGMSDGYYRLSALSPSSVGTGGGSATSGGFIFNQAMWLGFQRPCETSTPVSFFVIHNAQMKIDKTVAMTGESFTLSTRNYFNGSVDFAGKLGLIIEDSQHNQTVLNSTSEQKIVCGAGYMTDSDNTPALSMTGTIPQDLPDGDYLVYMASLQNGEKTWSRIRANAGYNGHYAMKVQGGKAIFSQMSQEPEAEGTLTCDHTIYTRCRSQFTARVRNTGTSEYFGIAHVGVYTEDAEGNTILIALCGEQQVSLPVGEETEIQFKAPIEALEGKTLTQGNYKACVLVEHQDKYYQMSDAIDITVKRIPSGMATLTCGEFSAEKNSIGLDEPLRGKVNVTNTKSVYSGYIGIIIFKKSSNIGTAYWEQEVFLEANASGEYTFDIPAQLPAGQYKASLRYNEGYTNEIATLEFEVRDEYVGVGQVSYGEVLSEEYFTLTGQKLQQKPRSGAYIIRRNTPQGTYTLKSISK